MIDINKTKVNDYIEELTHFGMDVNLNEIGEHIVHNTLSQWVNSWRMAFDRTVVLLSNEIQTIPDCYSAEHYADGTCLGYGKSEYDDEPCEECKVCPKNSAYEEILHES